MARVLVESLMVRYPLAGMMSWTLQYLVGLDRLGHDVVLVERANHDFACFDPSTSTNGPSCAFGVKLVDELLRRSGLPNRWCFVDARGNHFGRTEHEVVELFRTADVFIAMTFEECWLERSSDIPVRVLLDGDPVFRQIVHRNARKRGIEVPTYNAYFTSALNIGRPNSFVPDDGIAWRPLPHPVATELFSCSAPKADDPWTTIMNWRSYDPIEEDGIWYGHKDVEFQKFASIPSLTKQRFEIAIAGDAPHNELSEKGWDVVDAHAITLSPNRYHEFISNSLGEFSVCKHAYVSARSGWFSDRSGSYLASGRPVVLEDTGYSSHLPCGEGLLSFRTIDEAVDAVERVQRDLERHAQAAREIACSELEATKVMARMMDALP